MKANEPTGSGAVSFAPSDACASPKRFSKVGSQLEREGELESHLPARLPPSGAGEREFFPDRRERGTEAAKWAAYVREASGSQCGPPYYSAWSVSFLSKSESGLIEDLHVKSSCPRRTKGPASCLLQWKASALRPRASSKRSHSCRGGCRDFPLPLLEAIPVAPATDRQTAPAAEPVISGASIAKTVVADKIREPESPPAKLLVRTGTLNHSTTHGYCQAQIARGEFPRTDSCPWNPPGRKKRRRLAGARRYAVAGAVIIVAWAWQNLGFRPPCTGSRPPVPRGPRLLPSPRSSVARTSAPLPQNA